MKNFAVDIVPNITNISQTDAQSQDQGYTYNQAGFSYNQSGVMYGGLYNADKYIIPILSQVSNPLPINMVFIPTNAQLEDQGYTYNQAGFSYNQVGVMYGGIYNQGQDILPNILMALSPVPQIAGYIDIYTPKPTPSSSNNGPGFFMFLNL